jgi:hypothetical protein
LSDGSRVFDTDDVEALFGFPLREIAASGFVGSNDLAKPPGAALSRGVRLDDGLCGNGTKVGAGDTAMKGKK